MNIQDKLLSKARMAGAVLLLAFTAAGCGGGTPLAKSVTLTFWNTFETTENLQPLFEAYRQQHPNVQINYVLKNVDTYESDLLNALAAGNGPDIFAINNAWLPAYLDKITPAPATVFNLKDYKTTFVDVAANDFTKDSKIYGAPMSVDSLALYYNKDLLGSAGIATPPKTWDELASQVLRLKRQDRTGYFTQSGVALGTSANINRAVDIVYLMMLQQGAIPFLSDNLTAAFDQSVQKNGSTAYPGADALTFYTSFASPSSPHYNWNARSDYSIDAFANGRLAFLYSYSYARDTILQKAPNLNFDVAPVPQPNLTDPAVNFANYWGEVVSKQSKNSAAAWDFVKFLTSQKSLDQYYAAHKLPSSRRDLISLQVTDPDIGTFANANLTAKSFYKPEAQALDDIFSKMIDSVVLKGVDPRTAVGQAAQQATALSRQ